MQRSPPGLRFGPSPTAVALPTGNEEFTWRLCEKALVLPHTPEYMYLRALTATLFALWLWPQALSAQTQVLLNEFTLSSEGADVLLAWDLPQEGNVREFRLFRRINEDPTSAHLTTVQPSGAMRYTYLDDDIFKTEGRTLHYELQVVTTDGRVHRFTRSLSHNPTSVQRTWGSIKAMFRN